MILRNYSGFQFDLIEIFSFQEVNHREKNQIISGSFYITQSD